MSLDFWLTVFIIVLAVMAAGLFIWQERRPREIGKARLLPTTPLLFLCLLVLILAFAHLLSVVTGTPHLGRLG